MDTVRLEKDFAHLLRKLGIKDIITSRRIGKWSC
jgi:hypothetical protein